ncbi:FadR/GntR family transcriptional regulator [Paenibacillus cymbidii]|uniref:FadR/GntR family transcriptional regulator n=1 Tax=Paenibacillus cymbidii TaxID=1639034 RepID=UPI00108025DB|nr:FCD domain-containing protein [Paenibacillus cymbidii]
MKKMTYATALEQIRRKIETGEWKPGDRIPTLQQIAAELAVGVSSVREALRILENQRVVSIEHGRGMFVRNDPQLLEDQAGKLRELGGMSLLTLMEARAVLEPELAAFCAERASRELARELRRLADLMAEQMDKGGDFFATDLRFHSLIAEGADNPVLANMLAAISDQLLESRRQTNTLPNMRTKSSNYHVLIAIAIEERNAEQARSLMRAHILDMGAALRKERAAHANDRN